MNRRVVLLLVVVLVLLVAGCDWSQFGANPLHTSLTGAADIAPDTLAQLTPNALSSDASTGEVVTSAGVVLVQDSDTLIAYDATTQARRWSATLSSGTTVGSVPAVDAASNTVFVMDGGTNPLLLGFDVSGNRNCTTNGVCMPVFVASVGSTPATASPPVVADGRVYVNGAAAVYAFDGAGSTSCVSWYGIQVCNPIWAQAIGGAAPGVGPAVANGIVYDAAATNAGFGLAAFDETSGTPLWFGPLRDAVITATPSVTPNGSVVVPTASALVLFPGTCATSSCDATAILVSGSNEFFSATAAVTDATILATTTSGHLYSWPTGGCGNPMCVASASAAVDTAASNPADNQQTPAVENGIAFVLGLQTSSNGDDILIEAFDATTLGSRATWNLGQHGRQAGLANVSIAYGVVYAPTSDGVFTLSKRTTPAISVTPLALTPAFSPTTTDYVLSCAAGTNSETVTAIAAAGGTVRIVSPVATAAAVSVAATVSLAENDALIVEATSGTTTTQYWIRCLPHDFPAVTFTPHPSSGARSPGWYVTGNLALGATNFGNYAMILDNNGVPVWYKRTTPLGAIDVNSLGPNSVAFATAPAKQGFGIDPNGAFIDYDLVHGTTSRIAAVNAPTDFHELLALSNGDHIVLAYPWKQGVDLTGLSGNPAPGPNSTIADCQIQELDPQGNLVWSWTASDHIDPVSESVAPSPALINGTTVYDPIHCNSVDVDGNGNVLLSARNTSAVYLIDRATGNIVWKLGGTPTNKDGAKIIRLLNYPFANLGGQHDARFLPGGGISLFDDQTFGSGPAQGVELHLDVANGVAQPAFELSAPNGKNSVATGAYRVLPDGHRVIGWGLTSTFDGSLFTEVDQNGMDVLDASMLAGNGAYRVLKYPTSQFDVNALRASAGT